MNWEALLVTIGLSAGTTAFVVALIRFAGPAAGKLFGAVLRTRAELDSDRDRIIIQLRGEITDWDRRLKASEARLVHANERAEAAENRVIELEGFIDRFLSKLGTTRQAVENGGKLEIHAVPKRPTPQRRQRRTSSEGG